MKPKHLEMTIFSSTINIWHASPGKWKMIESEVDILEVGKDGYRWTEMSKIVFEEVYLLRSRDVPHLLAIKTIYSSRYKTRIVDR